MSSQSCLGLVSTFSSRLRSELYVFIRHLLLGLDGGWHFRNWIGLRWFETGVRLSLWCYIRSDRRRHTEKQSGLIGLDSLLSQYVCFSRRLGLTYMDERAQASWHRDRFHNAAVSACAKETVRRWWRATSLGKSVYTNRGVFTMTPLNCLQANLPQKDSRDEIGLGFRKHHKNRNNWKYIARLFSRKEEMNKTVKSRFDHRGGKHPQMPIKYTCLPDLRAH